MKISGSDDLLKCETDENDANLAFLSRPAADDAVLRRVRAVERREEASIVGTVEWVLRDDTNPFGDTAIGLTRQEKNGDWLMVVRQRFSDGRSGETTFPIDEVDLPAIRRGCEWKRLGRDLDPVTALFCY